METKKLAAFVVVLIIVIGVAVFLSKKFGPPKAPGDIGAQMVKRIDVTDSTIIERTVEQWESLGTKNGKYKNPKSGDYTMVRPVTCASCGELIPPVELPPSPAAIRSETQPDPREQMRRFAQWQADCQMATQDYLCPKCGEPAYGGAGGR